HNQRRQSHWKALRLRPREPRPCAKASALAPAAWRYSPRSAQIFAHARDGRAAVIENLRHKKAAPPRGRTVGALHNKSHLCCGVPFGNPTVVPSKERTRRKTVTPVQHLRLMLSVRDHT